MLGQVSQETACQTSFIVHEMVMGVSTRTPQKVHLKFYNKCYMEYKIEFDSFCLKYKECFNKSLTVVIEIAFV